MYRFLFYVFLIFLLLFRFITTLPKYKEGDLVRINGKILSQPTFYDNYQSFSLHGLRISLPRYPEIDYGDRIVVIGKVREGKLVDVKVESQKKVNNIILRFRNKIINFYEKNLPIDYAALVSGIVLGDKTSLSGEFREKLIRAGVIHVVVASGMNVTFVSAFLFSILIFVVKRNIAIPFVLFGILIYVSLSGFDAPIVRAGIMGSLVFLSQITGRLISTWRALFFSAILMLIIVPSWTRDLGFYLSFVATASLLLFQKKIDKKIKFVPEFVREGLSTSLAAQVGVAPIIFVTFGQFNPISPIINALVLWTIPFIMIIGAISGLIGAFIPILGKLIIFLVYPFASWFTLIINFFT